MKTKGPVWKLFTTINTEKEQCNLCQRTISTAGRSSSGLTKHAERYHSKELKHVIQEAENKLVASQSLLTLLTLSFATASIPFSLVDNTYFKEFLKKCGITTSPEIIRKMICDMSQASRGLVENQLRGKSNLTISFDGWSSKNCLFHCYAVFVMFVDNAFNRHILLIGCKSLDGKATSERVSGLIAEVLETVSLGFHNVKYAVTDNGRNLVKLADSLDLVRLPCVCHVLSNFFKVVFESPHLNPVLKKAKATAGLLCKSLATREKFYSFSKIVKPGAKCPRAFCSTRWAGAYLLLKDYIDSIDVLRSIPELVEQYPSQEEKETALATIDLVKDVFIVLTMFESDSSTASCVVPNLIALDNHISNNPLNSSKVGKVIKLEFRKRTSDIIKNMDFLVTTLLDPRFSFHKSAVGKTNWAKVEKRFLTLFEPLFDKKEENARSQTLPDTKQKLSPLENLLQTEDDSVTSSSTLKDELVRYKNQITQSSRPNYDSDPLDYWRINSTKFPLLSEISREIMSIPSSSAATERCFSRASYLYSTPSRNRLNQTSLDALLQVSARAHLIAENSKVFSSSNEDEEDSSAEEDTETATPAGEEDVTRKKAEEGTHSKDEEKTHRKAEKRRFDSDDDEDEMEIANKLIPGPSARLDKDEMETSSDDD